MIRRNAVLLLTAGAVALTAAPDAQAVITSSNVTSPADGTRLFDNQVTSPNGTVTVSGTTDSTDTSTDKVDIVCYHGDSAGQRYGGAGNTGIALSSDKSFNVVVPLSAITDNSCRLLAVPHGGAPVPSTHYTGPRVAVSQFTKSTLSSGPNSGKLYDLTFGSVTFHGFDTINSVGDCGPAQFLYDGTPAMNASPYVLNCAGTLYGSSNDFFSNPTTADLTKSEIQVDHGNAYTADGAHNLFTGSSDLTGFPSVTATLDAYNATTGDAQLTDTEPLVKCSPNNKFDPSAADCTSLSSVGVTLKRVTRLTNDGHVADVTDTWTSTDGSSHSFEAQYEDDLDSPSAGWMLPGQSTFTPHTTGQTAPAPQSAPGAIYGIFDSSQPPSFANPVSAMTFGSAYSGIRFDNTLWSAYSPGEDSAQVDFQRTIPAHGSVTIQWSYSTGASLATVQAAARAAEDRFKPAAIAITSPTPGRTFKSSSVTVSGTASAGSGVKSVTVNGVRATLKGTTWTATVKLVPGVNALTAVLTSNGASTTSASRPVTYKAKLRKLTLNAKPHHDKHAPYGYKLSGKLSLPTGARAKTACTGTVSVSVKHGQKTVATRQAKVGARCGYSVKVSFTAMQLKGKGKLTAGAHFKGNGVLQALSAKSLTLQFG